MLDRRIWGLNLILTFSTALDLHLKCKLGDSIFLLEWFSRSIVSTCFSCFVQVTGGGKQSTKISLQRRILPCLPQKLLLRSFDLCFSSPLFFQAFEAHRRSADGLCALLFWGDRFFWFFVVLCLVLCFRLAIQIYLEFFKGPSRLATPVLSTDMFYFTYRLLEIVLKM